MNINDTKSWLERARVLNAGIMKKRDRLQALRDLATSTTAGVSDMPRSDSPNLQRMESVVCRIVDLEREIRADEDSLVCVRDEIGSAIAMLEDEMQICALKDRFLLNMKITDIADDLLVTDRHVRRLIASGTEAVAGIF